MEFSEKGLDWLKRVERLSLVPYDDQTGKRLRSWNKGATIGYGHLISESEWPKYQNGIGELEAAALLRQDLLRFIRTVREVKRNWLQHEFDAAVIFAFNIGTEAFRTSTARKMLVDPFFKSTAYRNLEVAWKAYNKSQGKVNKGVVNRRDAEWDMFSKGVYRHW